MNLGMGRIHPLTCLCYYTGAICYLFLFKHPWFIAASLLAGILLNLWQGIDSSRKKLIVFFLGISLITFLLNPFVSHRGTHILFYLHNEPITLESCVFGLLAAAALFACLIWFLSVQFIFTSDKILHIFGRLSPKGAMLTAMALRSLPLITRRFGQISAVQRAQGVDVTQGPLGQRFQTGMKFMQAMLTWTLEEGLQTADSMKARGYGSTARTQFWPYAWTKRDLIFTIAYGLCGLGCLSGWFAGAASYVIFPTLPASLSFQGLDAEVFASYVIYYTIPLFVEGWERFQWRSSS